MFRLSTCLSRGMYVSRIVLVCCISPPLSPGLMCVRKAFLMDLSTGRGAYPCKANTWCEKCSEELQCLRKPTSRVSSRAIALKPKQTQTQSESDQVIGHVPC